MKGINHLVLAAHDLGAIRQLYSEFGFTLTPSGQHPFGTGNAIIQLHGGYLELLAVTKPNDIVEHGNGSFSFSAFNRDYLERHEGFSMVVFDTPDAAADLVNWKKAGLQTYEPFEFSRQAQMPDGREVKVGFSLAFARSPLAPCVGTFACQHYCPEYYAQPQFQFHANGAHHIHDVWISGPGALGLAGYIQILTGSQGIRRRAGHIEIPTAAGTIVLAEPDHFQATFGVAPPHTDDGPHLCGVTIAVDRKHDSMPIPMTSICQRMIISPDRAFGTAIAFLEPA